MASALLAARTSASRLCWRDFPKTSIGICRHLRAVRAASSRTGLDGGSPPIDSSSETRSTLLQCRPYHRLYCNRPTDIGRTDPDPKRRAQHAGGRAASFVDCLENAQTPLAGIAPVTRWHANFTKEDCLEALAASNLPRTCSRAISRDTLQLGTPSHSVGWLSISCLARSIPPPSPRHARAQATSRGLKNVFRKDSQISWSAPWLYRADEPHFIDRPPVRSYAAHMRLRSGPGGCAGPIRAGRTCGDVTEAAHRAIKRLGFKKESRCG